jgi:hypothetical protein
MTAMACFCWSIPEDQSYGVGAIDSMAKKSSWLWASILLNLAQARELHFTVRKTLATGVDPMAERRIEARTKEWEEMKRQREAENNSGDF